MKTKNIVFLGVMVGIVGVTFQASAQAQAYVTNTGQLNTTTTDDDSGPQLDKTGRPIGTGESIQEDSGKKLNDGAITAIVTGALTGLGLGAAGAYLYKVEKAKDLQKQQKSATAGTRSLSSRPASPQKKYPVPESSLLTKPPRTQLSTDSPVPPKKSPADEQAKTSGIMNAGKFEPFASTTAKAIPFVQKHKDSDPTGDSRSTSPKRPAIIIIPAKIDDNNPRQIDTPAKKELARLEPLKTITPPSATKIEPPAEVSDKDRRAKEFNMYRQKVAKNNKVVRSLKKFFMFSKEEKARAKELREQEKPKTNTLEAQIKESSLAEKTAQRKQDEERLAKEKEEELARKRANDAEAEKQEEAMRKALKEEQQRQQKQVQVDEEKHAAQLEEKKEPAAMPVETKTFKERVTEEATTPQITSPVFKNSPLHYAVAQWTNNIGNPSSPGVMSVFGLKALSHRQLLNDVIQEPIKDLLLQMRGDSDDRYLHQKRDEKQQATPNRNAKIIPTNTNSKGTLRSPMVAETYDDILDAKFTETDINEACRVFFQTERTDLPNLAKKLVCIIYDKKYEELEQTEHQNLDRLASRFQDHVELEIRRQLMDQNRANFNQAQAFCRQNVFQRALQNPSLLITNLLSKPKDSTGAKQYEWLLQKATAYSELAKINDQNIQEILPQILIMKQDEKGDLLKLLGKHYFSKFAGEDLGTKVDELLRAGFTPQEILESSEGNQAMLNKLFEVQVPDPFFGSNKKKWATAVAAAREQQKQAAGDEEQKYADPR
ncbi:MAG: hypothetical protein WCT20_03465 [Candidatus Babeliales bacterium]